MKSGILRIGTSNIVVPGTKQQFPEAFRLKSRLNYYGSLFNTVELNSTFYKLPMQSTFSKWTADVPADFQFSIKLSKTVTHGKNLVYDSKDIESFLQAAAGMSQKAGCLLLQFPGKITLDYYTQVEQILHSIASSSFAGNWRIAVECRSDSWYVGETDELLNEFGATLVLHDIPKGKIMDIRGSAPFIYQRFHGPAGDYRGSYTDNFLQQRAELIKEWLKHGKDVYVYVNNTLGNALENANSLISFCKQ